MTSSRPILVVDDDSDIRETLVEILLAEGYQALSARDGEEALKAIDSQPGPFVILLDLMMPVMSGGEFLERLRQRTSGAAHKVIVISAARAPGDRPESKHAEYVLTKPFELVPLLDAVREHASV